VWSDVWRAALAFFLVVVGIGLGYLFWRLGNTFGRLSSSLGRITDEVVPILNRTQTTVDGINLELERVDDIMQSAVGATRGAERAVGSVSKAVTTPVKKASGLAAGVKEGVATLRSRRSAERADAEAAPAPPAESAVGAATTDTPAAGA
jgi:hypothetical protein